MNNDVESLYNVCRGIIESMRYKLGTEKTLVLFVKHWAYLHTSLYPLQSDELEIIRGNHSSFCKLQHSVYELAITHGESDPIGKLMCEYSSAQHQFDFYPTPIQISKLLNQLVGVSERKVRGCSNESGIVKISEICCGTGSIILESITDLFYSNIEHEFPLGSIEVYLEEINPLCCMAVMLQIVFKLEHLALKFNKNTQLKSLQIINIDVLSRKNYGINYISEPAT